MKKFEDYLKEGNEGENFRNVVENLDKAEFEQAALEFAKEYHKQELVKLNLSELKTSINKAKTIRELRKIAEKMYGNSHEPELQIEAYIEGVKRLFNELKKIKWKI